MFFQGAADQNVTLLMIHLKSGAQSSVIVTMVTRGYID